MADYIGRKLKYKGEPDHTARTVERQDKDWLELSDNKRIPVSRVSDSFEEVDLETFLQPNATHASLAQIYENAVRGGTYTPPAQNQANIIVEEIDWNAPNSAPRVLKDGGKVINDEEAYVPTPLPAPPKQDDIDSQNQQWLKQHGMEGAKDDDLEAGAQTDAQRFAPQTYRVPGQPAPAEAVGKSMTVNYTPAAPNHAFGKLKKSYAVQLNIVLEEKIPDIEAIRYINNLFEDSIIDQLASEFTQKLLSDPYLLEEIIKANLEDLVYPDRKKKKAPRARKPAAKNNPTV